MSKFIGTCVVMGVKSRPSQDGTRIFRNAVLYFEEDTTTLEASISEEESSEPKGRVIQQSPDAGSQVEPGSTVAIVVSSGEEEERTRVPNVIGKLRREAVDAIRAAGLQPSVEEEETGVPGQVGRVTDQFPPPGTEAEPGETVTITVGKRAVEPVEEAGEEE